MTGLVTIEAEKRLKTGTGTSRDFRSKKKIPGIIYGEKKDPIPISLDEKDLKIQIADSGFFSKQCEIKLKEETLRVLPKDIHLHPVKENILHIDFLRVGENTIVTLFVPVKFVNENECEGIKQGGVLNIVRHEVELRAPVSKIPEFLEANLSGLEIGDNIHISSVKLEDGVSTTIQDRDFTIATVAPPTVMKIEEPVKEEGEGEEEGDQTLETKEDETPGESKEKTAEKDETSPDKPKENKES
ncbi:MAG: 50S ribosomal protein L25/general stress protein Ctc [Pseudomonadota bacterium]|nr:50S ribosomal protein L25/general stress protein Ctc [Pseudomonadota bacterium]